MTASKIRLQSFSCHILSWTIIASLSSFAQVYRRKLRLSSKKDYSRLLFPFTVTTPPIRRNTNDSLTKNVTNPYLPGGLRPHVFCSMMILSFSAINYLVVRFSFSTIDSTQSMYDHLAEIVYDEERKEMEHHKLAERLFGKAFLDTPPQWLQDQIRPTRSSTVKETETMEENLTDSFAFLELPGEIIPHVLQHLPCSTVDNLKIANKECYKTVQLNWKYLDRQTIHEFAISRKTPDVDTKRFLDIKVPLRKSILDAQEVLNFSIECGSDTSYWWNYCLREVGTGEYPTDRVSPVSWKRINCAPPVWDLHSALERHCMFFFHQCKVENLIFEDLTDIDTETIIDCLQRSMLQVHRITLLFTDKAITEKHVELITASKAQQVTIEVVNQSIPPSLWSSKVVLKAEFIRVRGFAKCLELTDDVLLRFQAKRIHLFGQTSVTTRGLKAVIDKWMITETELISFYLINNIPHEDLKIHLNPFLQNKTDRMRQFSRKTDGESLYIGIDKNLFALSKSPRLDENPKCEMKYLGGLKL